MTKDIDLYRSRELAGGDDEYANYLRRMHFHEQRAALQRTYWENQGKHQTSMAQLADGFEDARQQLEARRKFGPKIRAAEYEKRLLDVQLDIAAKRQMLGEIKGRNPKQPRGNKNDLIRQALIARRDQLAAEGLDTTELDKLIEEKSR